MPTNANNGRGSRDPTSIGGPYQRMHVVAFFFVLVTFVVGVVLWQISTH